MPLFKKNNDNKHTGTSVTGQRDETALPQQQGHGRSQNVDTVGYNDNTTRTSVNRAAGAGSADPGYAGRGPAPQAAAAPGGQQYADYGNTQGVGNATNVPPTGHISQGTGHANPGRRMEGKVEHAVGTLVGSTALQARGAEKEQEANAFKMQSQELAEAERLEREAMLRRERAVGHGAHPDNRHLGGPNHNTTF